MRVPGQDGTATRRRQIGVPADALWLARGVSRQTRCPRRWTPKQVDTRHSGSSPHECADKYDDNARNGVEGSHRAGQAIHAADARRALNRIECVVQDWNAVPCYDWCISPSRTDNRLQRAGAALAGALATFLTIGVLFYTLLFSNSEADQIPDGPVEQVVWWTPALIMSATVTFACFGVSRRQPGASIGWSGATVLTALAWYFGVIELVSD